MSRHSDDLERLCNKLERRFGRTDFPVSVLSALNPGNTSPDALAAGQKAITDYLTAKTTAVQAPTQLIETQKALLNPALNPLQGCNLDAWSSQLTLMDGSVVGHEFANQGISSPSLKEYLATLPPAQTKAILWVW